MADSKNIKWADDYKEGSTSATNSDDRVAPEQPAANDADGWQQYRRWISKAPAPKGRRVGIDPSLYTWKGYRNWSEQVKRNWTDDVDGDGE
ncbi:MAG: hypothetical protein KJO82_11250 [Gammaproteobacteria bacterium]|nr:hypothetical protein [Gammaproteobacteria bacterium]